MKVELLGQKFEDSKKNNLEDVMLMLGEVELQVVQCPKKHTCQSGC